MLRYNVEKLETSYVQVPLLGRRKDKEKFNQIVYGNYKLDEFIYSLDVMISAYDKVIANEPLCNVLYQVIASIYSLLSFSSYWSQNELEHWRKQKPFLKLKSKLGLYHVLLTTPKTSPEKNALTLVEMQQMPKIGKVDSKNDVFCLKWTKYSGRRKVCKNFKTDMDKFNIVVDLYWNNTYVKDTEMELKLTEYEKTLTKRVFLLSYIDVFFKRCILLDETTLHN